MIHKTKSLIISIIILGCIGIFAVSKAENISSIDLTPQLDISRFASYTLGSTLSGNPSSVSAVITGINGDGNPDSEYSADGTPIPKTYTKTMTYNAGLVKWINASLRPDDLYPEINFVQSSITWGNSPLTTNIRRNYYHLLHYENPFTMVDDMNFFIEINTTPVSTVNSADLVVYIVKENSPLSFFRSDWRNSPNVEIVGSFSKSSSTHHVHSSNSEHMLKASK